MGPGEKLYRRPGRGFRLRHDQPQVRNIVDSLRVYQVTPSNTQQSTRAAPQALHLSCHMFTKYPLKNIKLIPP